MTSKAPQNIEKETRVERVRRGPQVASSSELRIVEWQNEWIVKSAFPYAYQAPDEMLAQLRQRYRLDEVIQPGQTEFEQMLLLREWVHNQWNHGWRSRTLQARNALEILEAAERGSDFSCSYYSITIMQCLLALGFVARRFGISKAATEWVAADEGNLGHSITEVWSHQFHKWVLLDADMNVHYERDGIPLSVLEIHDAWVGRRWNEVRMVQGPTPFRMTDKRSGLLKIWYTLDERETDIWTFARHDVGDYYAHVNMFLGNTHHSSEGELPMLRWMDQWTPPNFMDHNQPNTGSWTGNVHDMYPTVDQVQINLEADRAAWEQGEAALDVSLTHSMPNLDKLLVRLDHEAWRETAPDFSWSLRPGKNEIMAKGINAFGREGHISRILLRYHP